MNPIILDLGPFQVTWYGLLIVTGAVIAAWIATKEAARRGEDPEHVWNVLTWCLIFGIIGARLYHVFSSPTGNFAGWSYYRENPIEIIRFWNGGFRGLGIFGGVVGGVLAIVIYTWRARLNLLRWLDIPAPGLLVAQAIGRLGNRVNQELYGPPTDAAWAFHINPRFPCQEPAGSPMACGIPERLTDEARQWYATHGFHPTFFYEMAWNIVGAGLLLFIGRRFKGWLRDGDIFLMYLIWYPVGRIWVEMFRPDAWRMGSLATAQWVSLIGIAIGVIGLIINHRRPRPAATGPAEPPAQ
ncbi:MAG: Prolipoprotein diacylglyceryl transferase [Chloroflexi bacterium ADurb.Bin325]|nr:MAG: Prolipoprotein diacylglyceryl transferase [Chloroflexi bacterium ADurb.Bin325]